MSTNTQIDAYRQERPPKQHDLQLVNLIKEAHHTSFDGRVLDIGCAAGSLIGLLKTCIQDATFYGFDIAPDLIELAKKKHPDPNCSFSVGNALDFSPKHKYDIIIASGVLSIFEDYEVPLKAWLSWLAPHGKLYIFGRFNSSNIDTIIRFRNNTNNSDWEGGLTSYSIQSAF